MYGIYYLFSISPVWLTIGILYTLFIGILHIGRERYEGFAYNVAWSSQFGDIALIMVILIPAGVLQRHAGMNDWYNSLAFQTVCAAPAAAVGVIANSLVLPARQVMDRYHNTVVVPLFAFLLLTMLPVTYSHGSLPEKVSTVALILFWLVLVVIDHMTGRINQRVWLEHKGVTLA